MITDDVKAEEAHNALTDSDEEYGRLSAYVKMAPHVTKLIKAKAFLNTSGTVAERESMAYASDDYRKFTERFYGRIRDSSCQKRVLAERG